MERKSSTVELAIRPRKKQKTAEEGSSDDSSSAPIAWSLFFDSIPQELLDNILRFLSLSPLADNWSARVPLSSIAGLYRINGALGAHICGRFNTLCISCYVVCDVERNIYKWKFPNDRMLWTDDFDMAHDFVMSGGGESLFNIIIASGAYKEMRDGREMVADFRAACPNLRSLSVVEKYGRWASAFATQLEKLDVVNDMAAVSIPNNCPSLRELNYYYEYHGLEDYDDKDEEAEEKNDENEGGDGDEDAEYEAYGETRKVTFVRAVEWECMGAKLESLVLSGIWVSKGELKRMRKHCPNLKSIDIGFKEQRGMHISKFIASYGEQLDLVCINNMGQSEMNLIVGECKNARFHAVVRHEMGLLPTLRTLGSRLEKVDFGGGRYEFDPAEWTSAWNLCPNLEVICSDELHVEEVPPILATPKHRLKEIRIPLSSDHSNPKEIMDKIAEGTKSVEILHINLGVENAPSDTFHKFIDKNKSKLRSFSIVSQVEPAFSQSDVDKLVSKLLECPLLQDILLVDVINPAKGILSTLRKRGIYIYEDIESDSEEEA